MVFRSWHERTCRIVQCLALRPVGDHDRVCRIGVVHHDVGVQERTAFAKIDLLTGDVASAVGVFQCLGGLEVISIPNPGTCEHFIKLAVDEYHQVEVPRELDTLQEDAVEDEDSSVLDVDRFIGHGGVGGEVEGGEPDPAGLARCQWCKESGDQRLDVVGVVIIAFGRKSPAPVSIRAGLVEEVDRAADGGSADCPG